MLGQWRTKRIWTAFSISLWEIGRPRLVCNSAIPKSTAELGEAGNYSQQGFFSRARSSAQIADLKKMKTSK